MKRKIGRPCIDPKLRRGSFQLTLTDKERQDLKDRATAFGMSASAWVRMKIYEGDDGR